MGALRRHVLRTRYDSGQQRKGAPKPSRPCTANATLAQVLHPRLPLCRRQWDPAFSTVPTERSFRFLLSRRTGFPGVVRDPIHFPGLAVVGGEGLLEVTRVGRDGGDHEADEDGAAVEGLLVQELAAPLLEFAHCRYAEATAPTARDIQTPLVRFGVVQTQGRELEVALWPLGFQLHQVGAPVPNFAHDAGAVVLPPDRGAREGMQQPRDVGFPGADLEVKVVMPVVHDNPGVGLCPRGCRQNGDQDGAQPAMRSGTLRHVYFAKAAR